MKYVFNKDQKIGDGALGGVLVPAGKQFPKIIELSPELMIEMNITQLNELHQRMHDLWDELGEQESGDTAEGHMTRKQVFDAHILLGDELVRRDRAFPEDDEISETGPTIVKRVEDVALAIVGDGPAEGETDPFRGVSGDFTKGIIRELGVEPEHIFWTNVYPERGQKITDERTREHGEKLLDKLNEFPNLKAVLAFSVIAAEALTNEKGTIQELRMQKFETDTGVPIIVTYHPAAVQRTAKNHRHFKIDIRRALEVAGLREQPTSHDAQTYLAERLKTGKESMLVPAYVSLVGSSAQPEERAVRDMDILIREDLENTPKGWRESVWLLARKLLDPHKLGLDVHVLHNAQGPHLEEGQAYVPLFDLVLRPRKEIDRMMKRIAKVDLGCGSSKPDGFFGIDAKEGNGVDLVHDLEEGIPLPDNSVDELRASHSVEHLNNPKFVMAEIYRVLKPGGIADIRVPSTKGEGAWAHPDHKSFWNKLSFQFYTDPMLIESINFSGRFEIVKLTETEHRSSRWETAEVHAILRAVKDKNMPAPPIVVDFADVAELWDTWTKQRVIDGELAVKPKTNGFRAFARKQGDRVTIEFEGGFDRTDALPELANEIKKTPGDFVLDGDVAIEVKGKRAAHSDMLTLNDDEPVIPSGGRVIFSLFDAQFIEEDLTGKPWEERHKRLRRFFRRHLSESNHVKLLKPTKIVSSLEELERVIKSTGKVYASEGAIIKTTDSTYSSGAIHVINIDVEPDQMAKKNLDSNLVLAYEQHLKDHGWDPDTDTLNVEPIGERSNSEKLFRLADGWGEWYFISRGFGRYDWVAQKMSDVGTFSVAEEVSHVLDKDTIRQIGWGDVAWDRKLLRWFERSDVEKQKPPGEEGGTRSAAARRFWKDNWFKSFPKSGKGKFVYHHHWRGLDEDASKLTDKELMSTNDSVHGDWRFSFNDALWGFTVFTGQTQDNRRRPNQDKLIDIKPDEALQGAFKLKQPKAWLEVGRRSPLRVEPGGIGATANKWSSFIARDHGTYEIGVWKKNFFEIFLKGKLLKGRYIISFAPLDGRRVWLVRKPEDQTPFAQSNTLEDEVKEARKKNRKWLIWGEPGTKPRLINVKEFDVEKRFPTNVRGQTVQETFDAMEELGRPFSKEEANYKEPSPDSSRTCGACRFFQRPKEGAIGRCQVVDGPIAWFATSDNFIDASAEAAATFAQQGERDVREGADKIAKRGTIIKASKDAGFVLAPVLVPDEVDLEGDVISAEEIERAAHNYMADFQNVGLMHQRIVQSKDVVMVESHLTRTDQTIAGHKIRKGTWLGGFRVINQKIRDAIKEGRLTGVSIGGMGTRKPVED